MHSELVVKGVSAGYGGRFRLEKIDAAFSPGQVCVLLGPNGAGKTTLLRALAGVLPVSTGEVSYGQLNLLAQTPMQRARVIAAVPQNVPKPPSITVSEAVSLAQLPKLNQKQFEPYGDRVGQALAMCGIAALKDEQCASLSSGQWRKVLVAQGIAQETPVLLLDEPTAFLDPPAQFELLAIVRRLSRHKHTCVVMVMHDPMLASSFADSVLLMRGGKVIAQGSIAGTLTESSLADLYGAEPGWISNLKEARWPS